jgi:hypothetical protein
VTTDVILLENAPTLIAPGLLSDHYDGYIFLAYSPGIPFDNSPTETIKQYSLHDGQSRVCFSFWNEPHSQPYCSYACYQAPNVTYSFDYGWVCNGSDCTREMFSVGTLEIISNHTDYTPPGNDTNTSDGYALVCKWKIFLMLIIASLYHYC